VATFQLNCPYCGTKSVAFTVKTEFQRGLLIDTIATCGYCDRVLVVTLEHGEITELVPPDRKIRAPSHTPDNVKRYYIQGEDNLPTNWDAAGVMYRKALEAALRVKFPELEGSLMSRIDAAAREGKITAEMSDWAHRIRRLGNEAAHDEEPFSEHDAKTLSSFCHLVFLYLFTLPGMMTEAQSRDAPAR